MIVLSFNLNDAHISAVEIHSDQEKAKKMSEMMNAPLDEKSAAVAAAADLSVRNVLEYSYFNSPCTREIYQVHHTILGKGRYV